MKVSNQLCVIIVAVVFCVTAIELFALSRGIDGVLMTACVAAIVGIPTAIITRKITKIQNGKNSK